MEECRLPARFGQEQLRHAQAAVDRGRDRGGEDVGARASAEAGRLGVDVGDAPWVGVEGRQRDDLLPHGGSAEWGQDVFESMRQLVAALWPRARWRA